MADAVSQGQPASPSPLPLPVAPTGLTAVGGNRLVALVWDDPNNGLITRYQVRRRVNLGLAWGAWANVLDSNSYTTSHVVTGLEGWHGL